MKTVFVWNMNWVVGLALLSVCNLTAGAAPKDGQAMPQYTISSNAVVQDEIERIMGVCTNALTTEAAGWQVVESFLTFQGRDKKELLLQALLAYKGERDFQVNPQVEILKRTLIFRLADSVSEKNLIAFLVPYFETTTDPQMRQNLVMPLDTILFKNGRHPPAYEKLEPFLAAEKASPPTNFINQVMFQNNPHAALNTLAEVYAETPDEKKLLQATAPTVQKASEATRGHVPDSGAIRDEAMSELVRLSNRREWWIRLYVAAVMENEPYLRTPELVKELEQDTDPLVREKVSKLKVKQQPK
jgi:hypothetical protein